MCSRCEEMVEEVFLERWSYEPGMKHVQGCKFFLWTRERGAFARPTRPGRSQSLLSQWRSYLSPKSLALTEM